MNLAKQWDTKGNTQKSKALLYTNNKISETETRGKYLIYYSYNKNTVPRNKLEQGGKRPILTKLPIIEEGNQGRHKQMEACIMLMDWKNEHHQNVQTTQNNLEIQFHPY